MRCKTGRYVSLRGARGDEAISVTDNDCFASLALTRYPEFAATLLGSIRVEGRANKMPVVFQRWGLSGLLATVVNQ
jgi:hypothetical protein